MLVKGTYLNYVRPGLLPWLIVAALVLVALGSVAVIRDLRMAGAARRDEGHDKHGAEDDERTTQNTKMGTDTGTSPG